MTQYIESDDLETNLQLLEKASSLMQRLDKSLCEAFKFSGRYAEIMDVFLVELTNLFTDLCAYLNKHRTLSTDDQSALRSIVKCVPHLITVAWKLLSNSNLCKICSSNANAQLHINKLSAQRALLIQSAIEFVASFYQSSSASLEFQFKFVQDNIDRSEFAVRLDDRLKLEDEFDKFVARCVCTDSHRMAMKRALETAYELKRNAIKEILAKQRILEFIGHPKERVIADQLQELAELMPDLSRQQLHLCLRNFGYDFEQTLANLCERDNLPLDLKLILRVNDSFDAAPFFDKKMLPIVDDGTVFADDAPCYPPSEAHYGPFDANKLRDAMRFLERADDEVEVDGKVMVRQQFREREEGQTEDEATKLKAMNLRFVRQLEEGDNVSSDSETNEAVDDAQRDAKLAAEVGHSGRFNRPIALCATTDSYEDEYDDTFEHALRYSQVDASATTADEREAMEGKRRTRKQSAERPQSTAKSGNREKQTARPAEGSSMANAKETTKKQGPSSSAYTGGRERQLKERNKGKERQRGADKKAKKMQFF